MKLMHLAAMLLLLLAVGCTQPDSPAPSTDETGTSEADPAETSTVESETDIQLASVSFTVKGMT